jgi:hypothetical protein
MVIQINGDKWRLASVNGLDMMELYKDIAKKDGKPIPADGVDYVPLGITSSTHTLMGDKDYTSANYHYVESLWTINRTTGEMRGGTSVRDVSSNSTYWSSVETTGRCAPITLRPSF